MAKRKLTKKSDDSFWNTANQAPSAISLAIGFLLVLSGIVFPSVLGVLVDIAGMVLILAGIVGIYMLGGSHRKR